MVTTSLRALLLGFVFLQVVVGHAEDASHFTARREALIKRMGESVAILQGAPETRGYVRFRQDNNFYYLTGVETPGALLLIDGIRHRSILFLPQLDKEAVRWEGLRLFPGPAAQKATGIDEVMDISSFKAELERLRGTLKSVYIPLSPGETVSSSRDRALRFEQARLGDPWDGRISRQAAFEQNIRAGLGSAAVKDLSPLLDEMRRVKDAQEIDRLRGSARIGALGLREAIRSARPGMFEYQVAAIAEFVFRWQGALGNAFFPIVGSGPNSCFAHYHENGRKMEPGDIAVIDFGPDYLYYSADITRTFPVSGKFSEEQAKVYQIVLDAQKAAIAKIRPGSSFSDLDEAVHGVLERHGYWRFLTHGVVHYVGMATHDVGLVRKLEPGVVVAIEPGVYMTEKNLGIRIEDTVLVTREGHEILTADAPKEIADIEKLMTGKVMINGIQP